jgi:hypothetical protein
MADQELGPAGDFPEDFGKLPQFGVWEVDIGSWAVGIELNLPCGRILLDRGHCSLEGAPYCAREPAAIWGAGLLP